MTPRERTVLRAIVRALRGNAKDRNDMIALCASYGVQPFCRPVKEVAADLIEKLVEDS